MNNKYVHRWSIACETSTIDSGTNNISLINILEELQFSFDKEKVKGNFVVLPISLAIVSFWDNNLQMKGKLDYAMSFLSPKGKELWQIKPEIKDEINKDRFRTIMNINGLKTLLESGQYQFVIKQRQNSKEDYKKIANIPIVITMSKNGIKSNNYQVIKK